MAVFFANFAFINNAALSRHNITHRRLNSHHRVQSTAIYIMNLLNDISQLQGISRQSGTSEYCFCSHDKALNKIRNRKYWQFQDHAEMAKLK